MVMKKTKPTCFPSKIFRITIGTFVTITIGTFGTELHFVNQLIFVFLSKRN